MVESETKKVVVIGTSAGGMHALKELLGQLSKDFPLPVLVVQHISHDATGTVLLDALNRLGNLTCLHGKSGERLEPGHLYLAPSDHHLLIDDQKRVLVTKGAQENRWRPAIDPLFRSAAVAFGSGVIGVLLTGYLDDGTAGMKVIKRCGGVCIVQDPGDADYPDMPRNALNNVEVDHCVPLSEMGALIHSLVPLKLKEREAVPESVLIEAKIAELTAMRDTLTELVHACAGDHRPDCPILAITESPLAARRLCPSRAACRARWNRSAALRLLMASSSSPSTGPCRASASTRTTASI